MKMIELFFLIKISVLIIAVLIFIIAVICTVIKNIKK